MNKITVKIKRGDSFQTFDYEGDLNIPVTSLLEILNKKEEISWSCSCLQGLCGSCAMVINSQPKLACKTFLSDEQMVKEYKTITIEPLSKFPLINDLKVDKSRLYDAMKEASQWLESDAIVSEDNHFEYEMSLCLMCGCCLEACPNYNGDDFLGTPIAVSAAKLVYQERDSNHLKEIKQKYKEEFYPTCVKSLACEDVCPMEIPTQRAISAMNKKSVWRLWQLLNRD